MRVLFLLAFLLITTPCFAKGSLFDIEDKTTLTWNLTFVPPHNEPVVGDMVARYRLRIDPEWESKWARFNFPLTLWGVNKWQTSDVVGHGSEAWSNSDWSIERIRASINPRVEIGLRKIHLYTEYYLPLRRDTWNGHGMESNYYWLVGIGGRIE